MIPTVFAAPRIVRTLNVAAVGFSLAAATAAIFAVMAAELSGLVVGVPTLLLGLLWARLLRLPHRIGRTNFRWGWLASVPLAATNAALAGAALLAISEPSDLVKGALVGAVAGATLGVFVWGPALALTLLAFGAPIAWAQRLATKGLAGEERGERIVGAACALLGLAALVVSFFHEPIPEPSPYASHLGGSPGVMLRSVGLVFTKVAALLGLATGGAAAALAQSREWKRQAFVKKAEAGEIRGFRVDDTPEGKVLVRVSSRGEGYRVADFTEEVFLLDEEGRATEARALELPRG